MIFFFSHLFLQLSDPDASANNKNSFPNLYERWYHKLPSKDFPGEPQVNVLESGSDYSGFYMLYGVPAVDIRYEFDKVGLKFFFILYKRLISFSWKATLKGPGDKNGGRERDSLSATIKFSKSEKK